MTYWVPVAPLHFEAFSPAALFDKVREENAPLSIEIILTTKLDTRYPLRHPD